MFADYQVDGLFDEMLALFRAEGSSRLTDLDGALARQDAPAAYRLAHTMKGEAMAWGATDLANASRHVEEQAREGRLGGMDGPVREMERLFQATLIALEKVGPSQAA